LGPGSPAARLPGTCRPVLLPSQAESAQWFAAGRAGYSWRFRIPDTMPISFTECVLSLRSFLPGRDLGDFPVGRRDNFAAYQPATLVDDASPERPANAIGKVARGADLLLSTARQLLLFVALGHAAPAFLHCPLVLDSNGQRLAKRADSLSVQSLRGQGLTAAGVLELANRAPTGP
jgi:glutamyl/glutaminyl-tRNA synthetase